MLVQRNSFVDRTNKVRPQERDPPTSAFSPGILRTSLRLSTGGLIRKDGWRGIASLPRASVATKKPLPSAYTQPIFEISIKRPIGDVGQPRVEQ
jgi:hypothetical protein